MQNNTQNLLRFFVVIIIQLQLSPLSVAALPVTLDLPVEKLRYQQRLEEIINSGDVKSFKEAIKSFKKDGINPKQLRVDGKTLMEYLVFSGQPEMSGYFFDNFFKYRDKEESKLKRQSYIDRANEQKLKIAEFNDYVETYLEKLQAAPFLFSEPEKRAKDGSLEITYESNGNFWSNYSFRLPGYLVKPNQRKADLIVKKKANDHVLKNFLKLSSLDDSKKSASDLHRMLFEEKIPLHIASSSIRDGFLKKAEPQYENMLRALLEPDYDIIRQLSSYEALKSFNDRFEEKMILYEKHKRSQNLIDFKNAFKLKKTTILLNSVPQIEAELEVINSLEDLKSKEGVIFNNVIAEEVESIGALFDSKRNELLVMQREMRIREIREKLNAQRKISIAKYGMFLDTSNLSLKSAFLDIYQGNFETLPKNIVNDNLIFGNIINTFLYTKAQRCSYGQPDPNHIEITKSKCIREEVTKNGWGIEVGRDCLEWVTVGTGLYANPDLISLAGLSSYKQVMGFLECFWGQISTPTLECS